MPIDASQWIERTCSSDMLVQQSNHCTAVILLNFARANYPTNSRNTLLSNDQPRPVGHVSGCGERNTWRTTPRTELKRRNDFMPMDFPDMRSLKMAAEVWKFRLPRVGESDGEVNEAL